MFHDESGKIARRSEARKAETDSVQVVDSDHNSAVMIHGRASQAVRLTDFVFYQSMGELGLNFFMSTYIGDDPAVSILYYLPRFYAKDGYTNPGLQQSITATGLAGVSTDMTYYLMQTVTDKTHV